MAFLKNVTPLFGLVHFHPALLKVDQIAWSASTYNSYSYEVILSEKWREKWTTSELAKWTTSLLHICQLLLFLRLWFLSFHFFLQHALLEMPHGLFMSCHYFLLFFSCDKNQTTTIIIIKKTLTSVLANSYYQSSINVPSTILIPLPNSVWNRFHLPCDVCVCVCVLSTGLFRWLWRRCQCHKNGIFKCSLGGITSLWADDDTLVSHTGKGSFSNGSPNLIVGNVPSGSPRASLPHLSSLG